MWKWIEQKLLDPYGTKKLKGQLLFLNDSTDRRFDAIVNAIDKHGVRYTHLRERITQLENDIEKVQAVNTWLSGLVTILMERKETILQPQIPQSPKKAIKKVKK